MSMEPTGQADRVRFGFSGSAISDDILKRLRSTTKQPESSHLSLAIAEQLVEALHGRMGTLQDQRGAHYWFVVPLPPEITDAPPPVMVDTSALEGRSLLVVDDSSTVTGCFAITPCPGACVSPPATIPVRRWPPCAPRPTSTSLRRGGAGPQHARHGRHATGRPDPRGPGDHAPVLVMLTGISLAPTATQARNVGIHRVLSKPVSAPRLRQVLAESWGWATAPFPPRPSTSPIRN